MTVPMAFFPQLMPAYINPPDKQSSRSHEVTTNASDSLVNVDRHVLFGLDAEVASVAACLNIFN